MILKKKLTFEEIVSLFKTNKDFITEGINEEEFLNYIKSFEEENCKRKYKFEEIHTEYQTTTNDFFNWNSFDVVLPISKKNKNQQ